MQSLSLVLFLTPSLASPFVSGAPVYASQADDAEQQYRFLAGLFAEGHWELTVQESTKFLKQFPGHERFELARYRLAGSLFELDRTSEALPHFRALAGSASFEFASEVNLRLGQCELKSGNLKEAASALSKAARGTKDYIKPHAFFLLGEARLQAKEYAEGAAAFQKSIELDAKAETLPHARRGLAWCHFRLEKWAASEKAATDFLKAAPKHELASEVRFILAEVHFGSNRLEQALQTYASIPQGPYHELAMRGAGLTLGALERHRDSGDMFVQLIETYPNSSYASESRIFAGSAYLMAKDAARAGAILAQPAETNDPVLLYWRGKAAHESGNPEGALPITEAGLRHAKNDEIKGQLVTLRGMLLFQLDRPAEAAQAFLEFESAYNLHGAATAFQMAGQPQRAQECAERLLRKFPDSDFAGNAERTQLDSLFDQGMYAKCGPRFAEQYQNEDLPKDARVHALSRYAWCAYLQEQWAESQKAFDRVVAQYPDSSQAEEAAALAARSAFESGDVGGAQTRYSGYLERYPQGAHLDQVLYGAAQTGLGVGHLHRLVNELPNSPLVDDAHLQIARDAEAQEKWDAALTNYRAILGQPESEHFRPAQYGAAWCQHKTGANQEALETLRTLLGAKDGKMVQGEWRGPALELQLWSATETGDLEIAQNALAQLERGDWSEDRRWAAFQKLTDSARAAGDLEGAWGFVQQFLQRSSDPSMQRNALVEATWIALDTKQTKKAASTLESAFQLKAPSAGLAEASFFVGEAHFGEEQFENAAIWYARAINTEGSQVLDRALYKLGFTEMRQERFAKAAQHFSDLTKDHPNSELSGESLYLAGECFWKAGEPEKAIAPLQALRKKSPKHQAIPRALFRLGQSQRDLGQTKDAHETLATLVQTYGEFEAWAEAELTRGECLAALDRNREAHAAFDRVLKKDKGVISARARLQIGQLHTKQGNEEDALAEFLKVALLYVHPEEVAEAMYRAGGSLERTEDLPAARKQYEQAAKKHPKTNFGRHSAKRLQELTQ